MILSMIAYLDSGVVFSLGSIRYSGIAVAMPPAKAVEIKSLLLVFIVSFIFENFETVNFRSLVRSQHYLFVTFYYFRML